MAGFLLLCTDSGRFVAVIDFVWEFAYNRLVLLFDIMENYGR